MSGPNHVAGGIVFTGIFCSFWDVNIFSKPWYLVCALVCSLLPDIDHTKSLMGKLFSWTFLPQYLDRHYGHRTITHSLLIYFTLCAVFYFTESIFTPTHHYTLIYALAFGSHLIFDMMTVSGVPLFFPFKKNPCVIPGNPDYRLRVNNLKTESMVFVIFLAIFLFCFPLMKQGFWTTYNNQFGTLEHIHREYSRSKEILQVKYDYLSKGVQKKGTAYLVHSEPTKAFLFKNDKVFEINSDMKFTALSASHTKKVRKEKEVYFYAIDKDSLNELITDKVILMSDFQSSDKVRFTDGNGYKESNIIKLEYVLNPDLMVLSDTSHEDAMNQLEIKEIELKEKLQIRIREEKKLKQINSEIKRINNEFDSMTLSNQETAVARLNRLKSQRDNFTFSETSTEKIEKQIEQLQEAISTTVSTTFTGKFNYLIF